MRPFWFEFEFVFEVNWAQDDGLLCTCARARAGAPNVGHMSASLPMQSVSGLAMQVEGRGA
jgi:hypothetical protein